MLKESLRKLGPEFGFLAEEASEAEQNVMNRLDRSVKLDEVDTITFGLETDDGKIVKVYVKVDQADDFEKALADKLGEIDDIEEVLNELSKEYEIVDVEWPDENPASDADAEEDDGSDSMNKKVYDNPKEKAEADKSVKPKMEALTMGERLTISINEASDTGSLESRFTTASQLMVYHALLELGIPEDALTRSSFRVEIMKNIKSKALELTGSPTMKSALKTFINRSIDYEEKASQNKDAMNTSKKDKDKPVKESLTESVTQDFWNAFLELVNYVAATPEDAKDLLANPTMKQIMTRSSASLTSNVTAQLKTKLNDFKNSLSGDGSAAQLKAAGVSESYLRATEKLTEGASPAEITELFKALLTLADPSKDGTAADNAMKSSAWNSFFNAAKGSFSQKFGGPVRAKLNQLKAVLPTAPAAAPAAKPAAVTPTAESRKSFATALNMLNMVGEDKSLKNATLAHSYQYGSEKFDEGHPVEVIGEEGDSYIVKAFPIMANSHMKMKKTAIKLTGKINVPVGGNNGKIEGGLDEDKKKIAESQVPDWSFDNEEDNVIIQCATIKILLDEEEVEKLVKGITNKDTVIVRDAEDQTHKVAFSPRGSSIMVKKVGTPEGVMMKQGDVDDLLDFVSKGEDDEEQDAPTKKTKPDAPEEDAQPAGGDESAVPKEQEKT
jgi:hypothetical protein